MSIRSESAKPFIEGSADWYFVSICASGGAVRISELKKHLHLNGGSFIKFTHLIIFMGHLLVAGGCYYFWILTITIITTIKPIYKIILLFLKIKIQDDKLFIANQY